MDKMGEEAAAKFINALIKSVQTLCHGYLDFQTGIEIIGHINLSVDKGTSLDYILKEKVCKNAENSTLFISNSFHAEPKSEQEVPGKNSQTGNQNVQSRQSADSGEGRLSAISSISSALSASRERSRQSSTKDSDSSHPHQSTAKRKASDDSGSEIRPSKVSSHHDTISRTSSDSAFPPTSSSPVDSKLALRGLRTSDADMSETMLPQTANVTSDNAADIGVNLAGSVLEPVEDQSNTDLPERDDDSDGDLEVTFIKEEYVEGERSACEYENSGQQFVGGPQQRASEGMPDPSLYPVALHGSSSASATYVPSTHDQQFPPGGMGPSTSHPQPGPSGMRGSWRTLHGLSKTLTCPVGNSQSSSVGKASDWGTAGLQANVSTSQDMSLMLQCEQYDVTPSSELDPSQQGDQMTLDEFNLVTRAAGGLAPYTDRSALQKHSRVCPICGKGFDRREYFQDHMNMHNRIKAHKCSNCGSAFTYKRNLWQHVRDGVCCKNKNS